MLSLDILPLSLPTIASLSLLTSLYLLYTLLSPSYTFPQKSPSSSTVSHLPIVGALQFFTKRWDFFRLSRDAAKTGNFKFFLGKHPIVGLSGAEARKSRELSMHEGYAILFGASPNSLTEDSLANDKEFSGPGGYFTRRIVKLMKTENFQKSLPYLMQDVRTSLDTLAKSPTGITDPFSSIYRIVYQLTMRTVGCNDIANDPLLLEKTLNLYETVESSATAATMLFPWFPSPSVIKRTIAGGRLYMIFNKIVENRRKTGVRGDDPLQFLIDQGDDVKSIIEFVVGALFAGLLNSGVNVAWVLSYLAQSPEWLSRVRAEVSAAAAKHSTHPDPSAPLIDQLSTLPIEAWESAFPTIDLCLKDSIRLQLLGSAFRKNISSRALNVGNGEVVPPGAFVAYHLGDNHLNPDIFRDPEKWDPSRYEEGREEDKKAPYAWVGWGAARHPCLGMRFAKLEQNIITAFFIAMFDYELTDKEGTPVSATPPVDFNKHSATKAKGVYLKYTLRKT
ncbi:Sterol 14-demethylase [Lachnellula occidentalis]|uniref:Sterol 14-demethylase n=1 Tax=Lachnellula occidentalis TaxID=215460 RepID=A0A8H8U886_9HELO|nr:Sterol 14-demethylase [Lachnellula occidentalis]